MKSVMTSQQYFNKVQQPQIQRSKFNRSHGYKTTMQAGWLVPIYLDEALPGDTFNVKVNLFGRFATLIKPIMDNLHLDVHFFAVPNRLVWDNWQKFNGEQKNPGDNTNFLVPTITSPSGGYPEASIYDFMGLPTKIANLEHSALYNRAINLIWNEWYRDENMQNSAYCPSDDGPDDPAQYLINFRGKRKDYFTSALPFAQKSPPISVPLGSFAPVISDNGPIILKGNVGETASLFSRKPSGGAAADIFVGLTPAGGITEDKLLSFDGTNTGLTADLSEATLITINNLREAITIQQIFELDARGGTRYTEILRAHFGVISPDARLQRPEYLGGGTTAINVNPIAQTSSSDANSPQANLSAMATTSMHGNGFNKSFTEHELIIGFASIRADLNYQQGLPRKFSRQTRFDYYWPTFAHLGEQAILNKEIFATGTIADDIVFGYAERYADYRYKNSVITGLFRSNATASLDVWGLWQDFAAAPTLNDQFIREQPPVERVVAVSAEPAFILDCFFDEIAARPMPTFSTPGLNKI